MTKPPAQAVEELGHSPDVLAQRQAELLALLRQTVPEVMSDNQVDMQKLQDLLGQERLADPVEHYELNWAGKSAARREIQKSSSYTLQPTANSQQPTANSQQPTANSQQPTANSQQPTYSY